MIKKKMIKAAREKKIVTYKSKPIRLSSDFLAETHKLEENGNNYSNY